MKRHSLSTSIFHNRMADRFLSSRDRRGDFEVCRQENRAQFTPTQWLVLAALDSAISVLAGGPKKHDHGLEYKETRQWVKSRAVRPFSFAWICQNFSYDEERWREKLLAIEPMDVGRRYAVRPGMNSAGPRPTVSNPHTRAQGQ